MTQRIALYDAIYNPYQIASGVTVPTVILIGRDVETRKRVMYRQVVTPYFYMEETQLRSIKTQDFASWGVKKEEYAIAQNLYRRPLVKLYLEPNTDINSLTRFLSKTYNLRTYEADLASISKLASKFLIDHEIYSGFTIEDKKIKPIDADCPMRVWFLDFECLSTLINNVNPDRPDPINMVTWYDTYDEALYTIHTHPLPFKPLFKNHIVEQVTNSKFLLERLIEYLDELQEPDLVTAHNLDRYDTRKWINAMDENGLDKNLLSPKKIRNVDERRTASLVVKGRIFFDMLKAYKYYQNKELVSYSQEFIMEEEGIDIPKVKFPYSIADLWNDTAPVKYDELEDRVKELVSEEEFRPSYVIYVRNVLDVEGLRAYTEKAKLIEFYDGVRKDVGCLFTDLLMANRILDMALLRMCRNKVVLPTGKLSGKGGGFKGGLIIEPEPGIYYNVFVVDFSRQYPSIIRGFNISPETLLLPMQIESNQRFIKRQQEKGNIVLYDLTTAYAFRSDIKGIIPQLVDQFWDLRDHYTKLEREAREAGDEDLAETWAIAVKRTKSTLNAIFGVMGYASFRLFKNECSAAITFAARLGSTKTIALLRQKGFDIIYGDTDSAMFVDPLNRSVEEVIPIVEEVNQELQAWCLEQFNVISPPLILNTEALYSDFIILSKKFYCGKYSWNSKKGYHTDYNWKGLATVRSDSSNVERSTLKQVLQMMLDRKSKFEILNYWVEVMTHVLDREPPIIDVAYPLQITKRLENSIPIGYVKKGIPTHIKSAIYSNKYLGTDWRTGDKPRRLPIIASKLFMYPKTFKIVRSTAIKEYEVNGISTDEYYILPDEIINAIDWMKISTRLRGKAEKLFKFMNITLKSIPKDYYDPIKQVTLMSWLRA